MRRRYLFLFIVCNLMLFSFRVSSVEAAGLDRDRYYDQTVHVVQPGENLFRIALRYGVTVDAIVAVNGLSSAHTVYAGQQLIIPGASGEVAMTGTSPGRRTGYRVRPGDTLHRIATRYGVTPEALMRANGLTNPNLIYPGQNLLIPGQTRMDSEGRASGGSTESAAAAGNIYVVRAGDTVSSVAQRFGMDASRLASLNGITNPSAIYVGQVLRLSSTVPALSGGSKRIVVDLSEQHLYAYEGERQVYSFVASSGAAPSYTRTGEFQVQSKIPNAYGAAWNIWMPHWLGIYWAGSTENGIHALPILSNGQTLWAGYLGTPVSYGCIVLGTYEAELLYNWAEIGTPVSIKY